jgi:2-polyprenyl-3-methyl-5-hydroxy-6-metoxy-1,4-benzoquinol methylase
MTTTATKKYLFEEVTHCEMCGDPTDQHKVLGQRMNRSQGRGVKSLSGISVSIKKCNNCGLIYSSPLPLPFDLQDHYGIPPESYWGPEYFQWDAECFAKEISTFKKLVGFKDGMKALDIGAGIGKAMISLKNAGFEPYGLEPSESFYERAITKMNIDPAHLKYGAIENLDYPQNEFDFISFGAVLEHVYHPAFCITRAMQWLKPGGLISIDVPSSRYLLSSLINLVYKMRGTNFVTNLSPMHEPFHMYEFSLESFQKLSQKAGFTIVHHDYTVGDMKPIPKSLRIFFRKYMKMTKRGMQLGVWLKKV